MAATKNRKISLRATSKEAPPSPSQGPSQALRVPQYNTPRVIVQAQVCAHTLARFQHENRTAGTYVKHALELDFLGRIDDALAHYLLLHDYRDSVSLDLPYPDEGGNAFLALIRETYQELALEEAHRIAGYVRDEAPALCSALLAKWVAWARRDSTQGGSLVEHLRSAQQRADDLRYLALPCTPYRLMVDEVVREAGAHFQSPEEVAHDLRTLRTDRHLRALALAHGRERLDSPLLTDEQLLLDLSANLGRTLERMESLLALAGVREIPGYKSVRHAREQLSLLSGELREVVAAQRNEANQRRRGALEARISRLLSDQDDERLRLALEGGFEAEGIYTDLLERRLAEDLQETILLPLAEAGEIASPEQVSISIFDPAEEYSVDSGEEIEDARDPSLAALKIYHRLRERLSSPRYRDAFGLSDEASVSILHIFNRNDQARFFGGTQRPKSERVCLSNILPAPFATQRNYLEISIPAGDDAKGNG
jgi:hypothetical protein